MNKTRLSHYKHLNMGRMIQMERHERKSMDTSGRTGNQVEK